MANFPAEAASGDASAAGVPVSRPVPLRPLEFRAYNVLIYDGRPDAKDSSSPRLLPLAGPLAPRLMVVQWNIERGVRFERVVRTLAELAADVICLQEVDIDCERSGWRNEARELAERLQMRCAFVVEFEEEYSYIRSAENQGGGVHGNAILSRYDFDPEVIIHAARGIEWNTEGAARREPRRGGRCTLVAKFDGENGCKLNCNDLSTANPVVEVPKYTFESDLTCTELPDEPEDANQFLAQPSANASTPTSALGATPTQAGSTEKRLLVYSAHFEIFCGLIGRVCTLAEVFSYAKTQLARFPMQVLCGDLNTMAHGLARFKPEYCRDAMRWRTLGQSESFWLTRNVLAVRGPGTCLSNDTDQQQQASPGNSIACCQCNYKDLNDESKKLTVNSTASATPTVSTTALTRLCRAGLCPDYVVRKAVNPGFSDPWHPDADVTVSSFGGFYTGKLDWTLVMGLHAKIAGIFNEDLSESDHRMLAIIVRPDPTGTTFARYLARWGTRCCHGKANCDCNQQYCACGRRRSEREVGHAYGSARSRVQITPHGAIAAAAAATAVIGALAITARLALAAHKWWRMLGSSQS